MEHTIDHDVLAGVAEHCCPIAFVVLPTFVGALLWLWAILPALLP
jgi:hypothetical protein